MTMSARYHFLVGTFLCHESKHLCCTPIKEMYKHRLNFVTAIKTFHFLVIVRCIKAESDVNILTPFY